MQTHLKVFRVNESGHGSTTGSHVSINLKVREKSHHATWTAIAKVLEIFDTALAHAASLQDDDVAASAENFVAGKLYIRWPTLIQLFKKVMGFLRESNRKVNHLPVARVKQILPTQQTQYTSAIPNLITSHTILDVSAMRRLLRVLEDTTEVPAVVSENVVQAFANLKVPLPDEIMVECDNRGTSATGLMGKTLHPMVRAIVAHVARQEQDHNGKKTTPGTGRATTWGEESYGVWRKI
jgi:hypothetical protein